MTKRSKPWNKGFTKENHSSVLKISKTFKRKKLDNFKEWRDRMKESGRIRSNYPLFKRDGNLAELVGVILGDGHIESFPRSESLAIFSNAKNKGFVKRYKNLMRIFFEKDPHEAKMGPNKGCIRIRIYQKNISKRLSLPVGDRRNVDFQTPRWILKSKEYLKRYLRGLYEAEGSFCVHKPTSTYKFLFSNKNRSLLDNVYEGLILLGFHPHRSKYQIQVSKKKEVYQIKKLIRFRKY